MMVEAIPVAMPPKMKGYVFDTTGFPAFWEGTLAAILGATVDMTCRNQFQVSNGWLLDR